MVYKDATEGIVGAMRTILQQCERSKTVRRVIHTGSVVAAAPLKEDGQGFKRFVDESCWTPLNLSYGYASNEVLDVSVQFPCLFTCLRSMQHVKPKHNATNSQVLHKLFCRRN